MKKSTYVHPTGKVWLKACDDYNECDGECWYCKSGLMEKALKRLDAYEETGFEPEMLKTKQAFQSNAVFYEPFTELEITNEPVRLKVHGTYKEVQ